MAWWRFSSRGQARCVSIVVLALSCAACAGSSATASPAATTGSPSPRPTATPSGGPSPSASGTAGTPIDFDVDGTIGGQLVKGKLTGGTFTVPCAGAGADQPITVHWTGTAPPTNVGLQGEIDLKPGTWTFGGSDAQGTATLGVTGGKAADSLVATAGSVTTQPAGGTIDATFTNGPASVHLGGSWTCPSG